MHYTDAVEVLARQDPDATREIVPEISFVSPIVSAMLAAAQCQGSSELRVGFSDRARIYASNNGLLDAIRGNYQFPQRAGRQGISYTKLTRLATHVEVDACNTIINDLVYEQFAGYSDVVVAEFTKIVGELHDNVASHAQGTGYSCAQVYHQKDGTRHIEFAIADAGCGMLHQVQRIVPDIQDHREAIQWCLQRGHTTARNDVSWAQYLPDDAFVSPYPQSVATKANDDHHMGEGLWKLLELIRSVDGCLWIASGDGQFCLTKGKESSPASRIHWKGVAIEVELVIPRSGFPTPAQFDKIEALAKRLGL